MLFVCSQILFSPKDLCLKSYRPLFNEQTCGLCGRPLQRRSFVSFPNHALRTVEFRVVSSSTFRRGDVSPTYEQPISNIPRPRETPSADDNLDEADTLEQLGVKPSERKQFQTLLAHLTDGARLMSKGRLKEQDALIEMIIRMHEFNLPLEVMRKVEKWVSEHVSNPAGSTLKRLVPSIGRIHTQLPLRRALREYDCLSQLTRRRYVLPNFAEIRHVINLAQVHAAAPGLQLVTFDADGTLYDDGHNLTEGNQMIQTIIFLLKQGVNVAVVTAAAYPDDVTGFEGRLQGLLREFRDQGLADEALSRFFVMGGECNYLLRCRRDQTGTGVRLQFVDTAEWQTVEMHGWREPDIQRLLDHAEKALARAAKYMRLGVCLIRKPRAVGVVPKENAGFRLKYEVLEEVALSVFYELSRFDTSIPYCCFNGGADVFVDIGNKNIGIQALMRYLGPLAPEHVLHVGDRFTASGNDYSARDCCNILWVAGPEETAFFMRVLLHDLALPPTPE